LAVMDLEPPIPDKEVEKLIRKREEARKKRDWKSADRLRGELKKIGIEVIDTKKGTIWNRLGQ